jgi:uncharacterized protein YjbI with pentapeptide repeats
MKTRNPVVIRCLLLIVLCLTPFIAAAFKPADLAKLKATNECRWCDLRGADLSRAKLTGADLSGANLSQADLSGADLSGANLSAAYLREANLTGASLSGTFFSKANLNGANLSGAAMSGTDFSGATWTDGRKCEDRSVNECKDARVLRPRDEATTTIYPSN